MDNEYGYENESMNTDNAAMESAEIPVAPLHIVTEGNTLESQSNAAERGAEGNKGVYNHKFKVPFEFEGKKFVVLNFNFEKMTGRDMLAIETEMQANSEYALDPALSRSFQSKMAARAGGIGADALEAMPMQEFMKITNAARNFLIASGY